MIIETASLFKKAMDPSRQSTIKASVLKVHHHVVIQTPAHSTVDSSSRFVQACSGDPEIEYDSESAALQDGLSALKLANQVSRLFTK